MSTDALKSPVLIDKYKLYLSALNANGESQQQRRVDDDVSISIAKNQQRKHINSISILIDPARSDGDGGVISVLP